MTINFSQENNVLLVRGKIIDKIKTASVQKYERPSDITLVTIPIITNVLKVLGRRIRSAAMAGLGENGSQFEDVSDRRGFTVPVWPSPRGRIPRTSRPVQQINE